MDNNFDCQFDPYFFNRLIDNNGKSSSQNINSKINQFVKEFVDDFRIKSLNGNVPGTTLPASDINDFSELLAFIISKQQEYEGIQPIDQLEVREKYSDMRIERDTLAWSLKNRKPGLFAAGKVGNDHVQEYTMHLRGIFDDPYNPGQAIAAFGQKMDNFINLCIYSGDAKSANSRAIWLERVMDECKWIFHYNGFERVLFHERTDDTFEEIAGNRFHGRHLVYFVRSEKIVLYRVALLRKLVFDLCLVPPGHSMEEAVKLASRNLKFI